MTARGPVVLRVHPAHAGRVMDTDREEWEDGWDAGVLVLQEVNWFDSYAAALVAALPGVPWVATTDEASEDGALVWMYDPERPVPDGGPRVVTEAAWAGEPAIPVESVDLDTGQVRPEALERLRTWRRLLDRIGEGP